MYSVLLTNTFLLVHGIFVRCTVRMPLQTIIASYTQRQCETVQLGMWELVLLLLQYRSTGRREFRPVNVNMHCAIYNA